MSGLDGSMIWKDDANAVTNHVTAVVTPRSMLAVHSNSGLLVIAPDRSGLRAIEFAKQ